MTFTTIRRIDAHFDADLATRRLLLAAVVASLWPLLYARWCWLVLLQAHNARAPREMRGPPNEPLAGRGVPDASGSNVERCRCGHTLDQHWFDGSCLTCDCPAYRPSAAILDASPAMLESPVVQVVCEPSMAGAGFSNPLPEGGAPAAIHESGGGRPQPPSPHQWSASEREGLAALGTARPLVMPSANQIRAKMCDLCEDTEPHATPIPTHFSQLRRHTEEASKPEQFYVKDGKRYRLATEGDAGPRYRRDARRHYHLVEGTS